MQIAIPQAASQCVSQLEATAKPPGWVGDAAALAQARLVASADTAKAACAAAGWAVSALAHAQARLAQHRIVAP